MTDEAAPLRPPDIIDFHADILGDEIDNLVFEAFALVVGERQIVRIGADPQVGCASFSKARADEDESRQRAKIFRLHSCPPLGGDVSFASLSVIGGPPVSFCSEGSDSALT